MLGEGDSACRNVWRNNSKCMNRTLSSDTYIPLSCVCTIWMAPELKIDLFRLNRSLSIATAIFTKPTSKFLWFSFVWFEILRSALWNWHLIWHGIAFWQCIQTKWIESNSGQSSYWKIKHSGILQPDFLLLLWIDLGCQQNVPLNDTKILLEGWIAGADVNFQ